MFLYGIGVPQARLDHVLARSFAYAKTGADSLFVPGLTDLPVIIELAEASPLRVNVMAGPGASSVAELAAAGVRRVSTGTAIAEAAYTLAKHAATELLTTGSYTALEGALDFGTINSLIAILKHRPPAGDGRHLRIEVQQHQVSHSSLPSRTFSGPGSRPARQATSALRPWGDNDETHLSSAAG